MSRLFRREKQKKSMKKAQYKNAIHRPMQPNFSMQIISALTLAPNWLFVALFLVLIGYFEQCCKSIQRMCQSNDCPDLDQDFCSLLASRLLQTLQDFCPLVSTKYSIGPNQNLCLGVFNIQEAPSSVFWLK